MMSDPIPLRRVWLELPPGFADECERRGVTVDDALQKLMSLAVEVGRVGEQLVPGWENLTAAEKLSFLRVGTRARMDLEHPWQE